MRFAIAVVESGLLHCLNINLFTKMQFQHVQEGSGVASIQMKSINIAQISLGRKWHATLMHLWFYHL